MTEKEKTLTPRQSERRRAILETARRLLSERGYDGLSMRDVASEAGVSPSTLYEIYESKDALILQSIRANFDLIDEVELDVKQGLDRFVHRLRLIGDSFQNDLNQGEGISRLLFQGSGTKLSTEVLLTNAYRARSRTLEEMQNAGQIEGPIDIELLARTLVSITWGTVLLFQRGQLASGHLGTELVRQSVALLLPYAASPHFKRRMKKLVDDK